MQCIGKVPYIVEKQPNFEQVTNVIRYFSNEYRIDRVETDMEKQKGGIKDGEVSKNLLFHTQSLYWLSDDNWW